MTHVMHQCKKQLVTNFLRVYRILFFTDQTKTDAKTNLKPDVAPHMRKKTEQKWQVSNKLYKQ